MMDIRTPSYYFEERNNRRKKLQELNLRLDDVIRHLQELKEKPNTTHGYKKVVQHELDRVEKKKKSELKSKGTKVIVNKILDIDDPYDVSESIKDELDKRIFKRVEPHFDKTTNQMTTDIFDHK